MSDQLQEPSPLGVLPTGRRLHALHGDAEPERVHLGAQEFDAQMEAFAAGLRRCMEQVAPTSHRRQPLLGVQPVEGPDATASQADGEVLQRVFPDVSVVAVLGRQE